MRDESEEEDLAEAALHARPCCIRAFEVMHVIGFGLGLWLSPEGMAMMALPWLSLILLAALAISRLRLALVWLLLSAICVGILIFIPMGAAFQYRRLDGNGWAIARLVYVMVLAGGSLFFLWSRDTSRWLRAGGGRFSQLVF